MAFSQTLSNYITSPRSSLISSSPSLQLRAVFVLISTDSQNAKKLDHPWLPHDLRNLLRLISDALFIHRRPPVPIPSAGISVPIGIGIDRRLRIARRRRCVPVRGGGGDQPPDSGEDEAVYQLRCDAEELCSVLSPRRVVL